MEKSLTGGQLAVELGYKFLSLRRVYNRVRTDESIDLPHLPEHESVSPEVEQFIRARFGVAVKRPKRKNNSKPVAVKHMPGENPIEPQEDDGHQPQTIAASGPTITLLDVINYAEMLLASVGAWVLAGIPGFIVSLMTNAFYYEAVKTVKQSESWHASDWALLVTLLLGVVYGFLHFNTFSEIRMETQYDQTTVAICIAVIVSSIAWASLMFSKLKTKDRNEKDS